MKRIDQQDALINQLITKGTQQDALIRELTTRGTQQCVHHVLKNEDGKLLSEKNEILS